MNASNIVPIICAIIGAAGTIIAAWIGRQGNPPPKNVLPEHHAVGLHAGAAPKKPRKRSVWFLVSLVFAVLFLASVGYLISLRRSHKIEITITEVPGPGSPGAGSRGEIGGTVSGSYPSGAWVLLYACVNGGSCYIQPLDTAYKIPIRKGKWSTSTHLGDRYVALLAAPGFTPPAETPNPPGGDGVLASDEKRSADRP